MFEFTCSYLHYPQQFSKDQYNNQVDHTCVAHLFTYQSMPGNVLGLAYIGSPTYASTQHGGICSKCELRLTQ